MDTYYKLSYNNTKVKNNICKIHKIINSNRATESYVHEHLFETVKLIPSMEEYSVTISRCVFCNDMFCQSCGKRIDHI